MYERKAWIAERFPSQRSRLFCVCAALVTILIGLIWRLAPLHLPPFAQKYGGSALYAIMLYWLVAAGSRRLRPLWLGLAALTAAFAVESFKRVHTPALDAFRLTLAGKLLLGRYFSVADLAAYAIAIAFITAVDMRLRHVE